MRYINISLLFICFLINTNVFAQKERIELINPSFEDEPKGSHAPFGWYDCGMIGETPPDTQPGIFKVTNKPQDGSTYLGMVTRDNDTWEAVAQKLSNKIESGNCYQFNIYLTYSEEYFNVSRTTNKEAFFTKPVQLRIWAGNSYCDKSELLGSSDLITNTEWKEQQFILKPTADYQFLLFEVFYKTPTLFPYNGNVLIDNASDIVLRGNCEEANPKWIAKIMDNDHQTIALNVPKSKPKPKKTTTTTTTVTTTTKTKPKETKPTPIDPIKTKPNNSPELKYIAEFANPSEIKEGQNIRIKQLDFEANDYKLSSRMHPILNEIHMFMIQNPKVIIEIGGHTNNLPSDEYCIWLSENRASSVKDYLINKGLSEARVKFKGYGKILPIATNDTEAGRKKNQRVEVKILSL